METKKKNCGGIIMSPGCELNCLFCGGHQKTPDAQLKQQEINVYKNLQDFKREGLKKISISGSDPIEYDKITELISYMKQEGFGPINLSTHGVNLADPVFLKKLIASGVDDLRLPLYGSNAKIHDSVTRTPGSFDKLIKGVKNLMIKKPEIIIQISCLIFKQNKDDLLNVVDLVKKLGITNFYFSTPCIADGDYSFYIPLKDIPVYMRPLYAHALKVNKEVKFMEIPFCIFGKLNTKNINNQCYPPNLGKYNQPPEPVRTSIPDLPSYRLKRKVEMCAKCMASDHCDGFFVNDIDKFGVGNLQPIK